MGIRRRDDGIFDRLTRNDDAAQGRFESGTTCDEMIENGVTHAGAGSWFHDAAKEGGNHEREFPSKPPYVAFVGNVPFDASKEAVIEAIGAVDIESVRPIADRTGSKIRGYFVEFHGPAALREALKADGATMGDRTLRVHVAEERRNSLDKGGHDKDKGRRSSQDRGQRRNSGQKEHWNVVGDGSPAQRIVEPAANRPKLVLKPRSVETDSGDVIVSNSAIFGGAKPVDTTKVLEKVERQIDAELHRDHAKQKHRVEKKEHRAMPHHSIIAEREQSAPVTDTNAFSLLSIEDDE